MGKKTPEDKTELLKEHSQDCLESNFFFKLGLCFISGWTVAFFDETKLKIGFYFFFPSHILKLA